MCLLTSLYSIKTCRRQTKEQQTRPGRKGWELCWHDHLLSRPS